MPTPKDSEQQKVGGTFAESPGSSFAWMNDSDEDCTITACKPPLTEDTYVVPAHSSLVATVDKNAPRGEYAYQYEFKGLRRTKPVRTNPKIIVRK